MKKILFLLLIAFFVMPCAAKEKKKVSKKDDKPDYMLVDPETAKIFPKVEEPLTIQRGLQNDVFFVKNGKLTPAILSFKVLNRNNLEIISIDEWFQNERNNIYKDAVADTLGGLLPILDNLQYASKYSGGDAEKVAEGLTMFRLLP